MKALTVLSLLAALVATPFQSRAQTTTFTYQGSLTENGLPAAGTFDFEFRLEEDATADAQVGPTVTREEVAVNGGLFTVSLNFGSSFDGTDRWLEISVRPGISVGSFTRLAPRQPITSAPYAIKAASVDASGIAAGSITSTMLANGAVGAAQLSKGYQSGQITYPGLEFASGSDFTLQTGRATVSFSPPFNTAPVVTLGVETSAAPAAGAGVYVENRSPSGFSVAANVPVVPAPVDTNTPASQGGSELFISLAVIGGRPAIAFITDISTDMFETTQRVYYVRALDAHGTAWGAPVSVDAPNSVGQGVSMVEVDGTPAIVYTRTTENRVRYARAADAAGSSWTYAYVGTGAIGALEKSLLIVNGRPALSYYDGNLKYIRANDALGTSWPPTPVTIDASAGARGRYNSLAIVNTLPAISYTDIAAGQLRYVRAGDADGNTWNVPVTVDTAIGIQTSLAVISGNPAISYAGGTMNQVKFVQASDVNGNTWGTKRIAYTATGSVVSTALVEVNGNPAIGFAGNDSGFKAYYSVATSSSGAAWNSPVPLDTSSTFKDYLVMRLVSGRPAVAYRSSDTLKPYYLRSTTIPSSQINWIAVEP